MTIQSLIAPGIRPVTLDEIIGLDRYEAIRGDFRRAIIELKKHRRVSIGHEIDLVFENRATIFFQIHEMLRAERITDLDAVRAEIAVYNSLLPAPGELSATLLVGITQQDEIEARLARLIGIDEHVNLDVGSSSVPAQFEPGRSRADRLSAVQYIRFAIPEPVRVHFNDPTVSAHLRISHPNYAVSVPVAGGLRSSLIDDLRLSA